MLQESLWFWVHLSVPPRWDHRAQDWSQKSLWPLCDPLDRLLPGPVLSPLLCQNPQGSVMDGVTADPGKERLMGEAGMLEVAHFSGLHKEERSD